MAFSLDHAPSLSICAFNKWNAFSNISLTLLSHSNQITHFSTYTHNTTQNLSNINIYKINDIDVVVVAIVVKIFGKFGSVRATVQMPKVDYFWGFALHFAKLKNTLDMISIPNCKQASLWNLSMMKNLMQYIRRATEICFLLISFTCHITSSAFIDLCVTRQKCQMTFHNRINHFKNVADDVSDRDIFRNVHS